MRLWTRINRRRSPAAIKRLRTILGRVRELCRDSEDSDWSYATIKEILETLDEQISRIDRGESIDMKNLNILMLPTGPLQETSMDNGWAEEYLQLSEEFDAIYNE